MAAKATGNVNLANTINRIEQYINSGLSIKDTELDKDTLLNDCALVTSILVLENDYTGTPFILWDKFRENEDLVVSLKWIAGYLSSGYHKSYLKSCKKLTLNQGALVTKILIHCKDFPDPLFFLTDKVKLIFKNVIKNIAANSNEHNAINIEGFFNQNFNEDRIRISVQRWNPLITSFETYIYNSIVLNIRELLKKIDPVINTDITDKEETKQNDDNGIEDFDFNLSYNILQCLLFLTNIRPHKKLLFYETNFVYSLNRNIDTRGFYQDNFDKKLEDLYNVLFSNSKFWEIRNLMADFHQKELVQKTDKVYCSKSKEDIIIRNLAGNSLIQNLVVEMFFTDCISDGTVDFVKVGQRLASWNFRVKEAILNFIGAA